MELSNILKLLKMTEEQFKEINDEKWQEASAATLKSMEDNDLKKDLEIALTALNTKDARRTSFMQAEKEKEHVPLQTAAVGTPAYQADQQRNAAIVNPPQTVVSQAADGTSLSYTITGANPGEVAANKAAILAAYKNFGATKGKDEPKEEVFKSWEDLKKSNLFSDEAKEAYKGQTFPLTAITLKFDSAEDMNQFTKSIEKHIKPLMPAVEAKKAPEHRPGL